MRRALSLRATGLGVVLALTVSGATYAGSSTEVAQPARRPVAGTTCATFPADNYWHADVRALPVDPRGKAWLSHMSTGVDLHPDFGPSYGDGPNYGIPVTVVGHGHPRVRVRFHYASESDKVRYPLGKDTRIEGGRRSDGDRHAIVVDRGTCRLYETYATRRRDGRWYAGSGAVWSLTSDRLRPDGWTSADAAGLPILPGLLRWNEVKARHIDHAIRFTTDVTSSHHLWPARHDAGQTRSWAYPPMGARFRLRASYHPSGFGPKARAVVAAMKKYGLVLADNGSPWFFQGEQNAHWQSSLVEQLKRIPASRFVAVDTSSLKVSRDSGATP
jgi:hypothetical protein